MERPVFRESTVPIRFLRRLETRQKGQDLASASNTVFDIGMNNGDDSVPVDCITFDGLLKKYGVPYYLKLDVEGVERNCLASLSCSSPPEYVSVEAETLDYLLLLWNLGYRQFKIVDQMRHNSRFSDFSNENLFSRSAKRLFGYVDRLKNRTRNVVFPRGCSGPFGEDTPGNWKSVEAVAYNWLHLHFGYDDRGSLNPCSWYDFHAKSNARSVEANVGVALVPTDKYRRRSVAAVTCKYSDTALFRCACP